jgi:hypothetical protein
MQAKQLGKLTVIQWQLGPSTQYIVRAESELVSCPEQPIKWSIHRAGPLAT